MDDQANRPHRKTKVKKKHTGGLQPIQSPGGILKFGRWKSESIRIRTSWQTPKTSDEISRCTLPHALENVQLLIRHRSKKNVSMFPSSIASHPNLLPSSSLSLVLLGSAKPRSSSPLLKDTPSIHCLTQSDRLRLSLPNVAASPFWNALPTPLPP